MTETDQIDRIVDQLIAIKAKYENLTNDEILKILELKLITDALRVSQRE